MEPNEWAEVFAAGAGSINRLRAEIEEKPGKLLRLALEAMQHKCEEIAARPLD